MIDLIQWLGNGSFAIQAQPLIYINPWRIVNSGRAADIILISDYDYQQCSLADIAKLRDANTQVIGNDAAAREIEGCMVLRPWQSISIGRVSIKGIPTGIIDSHATTATQKAMTTVAKSALGFVLSVNYYDIYYAGATHWLPELASLRPDIALMPVNGGDAMTATAAAQAVAHMRPQWAIPYNWHSGNGVGNRVDAQLFASELEALQSNRVIGKTGSMLLQPMR